MPTFVAYFSLNDEEAIFGDYVLNPGIIFRIPHSGFEKLVSSGFLRKVEFEAELPPGIHQVNIPYKDFVEKFVEKKSPLVLEEVNEVEEKASFLDSKQSETFDSDDDDDDDLDDQVYLSYSEYTNKELYEMAESLGWSWSGRRSRKKAIKFLEALKKKEDNS